MSKTDGLFASDWWKESKLRIEFVRRRKNELRREYWKKRKSIVKTVDSSI